jgi:hypothetical protein
MAGEPLFDERRGSGAQQEVAPQERFAAMSCLHLVPPTRSRAGVHDSCPTSFEVSGPCAIGAAPTKSERDDPNDEQDYGNNPQRVDCKPEAPKDQCENQQYENYSHYVLFSVCLRALALAVPPSWDHRAP